LEKQLKTAKEERLETSARKNDLIELGRLNEEYEDLTKKIDEINRNHPKRYQDLIYDSKTLLSLTEIVKLID
jgi:hypothetical protein